MTPTLVSAISLEYFMGISSNLAQMPSLDSSEYTQKINKKHHLQRCQEEKSG